MGRPTGHRILLRIRHQRQQSFNVLVGMAIPLGGLIQLLAAENIPVLILVVVGVLTLRRIDADDKPPTTKRSLTVVMLVGLPRQMRESIDQSGGKNQPLVIERVESVEAVAYLSDIAQLFQRNVVFLTELFQFHGFLLFEHDYSSSKCSQDVIPRLVTSFS